MCVCAGLHTLSFSEMAQDLQAVLRSNMPQIRFLLKKSPALGYSRITELGRGVGEKYGLKMVVNFPKRGRIEEFEMYGRRDLSLIMDLQKTRFPIDRAVVGRTAADMLPGARVEDAYMYEGKEGLKVFLTDGGRIDVLPHSLHVWCEFTEGVIKYCDWLLANVYEMP